MSNPSEIYIDPGSTDAIPVYLVVSSGVNTYLPRAVLNDSSGNEITVGNPLNVVSTITNVTQGTSPWLVNASVVGQQGITATVSAPLPITATYSAPWNVVASQGATPWLVNASVVGQQGVTATYSSPWSVNATSYQGTSPWTITGTVSIGAGAAVVAVTNVTLSALATVWQGGAPWLVNSSVIGNVAVTASLIGTPGVMATYAGPWNVVVSQGSGTWSINASIIGLPMVTPQPSASAVGASIYSNISLVATCVTINVATTNLYGYNFYNAGSAVAFVSLFAQTLATMGKSAATDILAVPAGGWADNRSELPAYYTQGLLIGASASINGTGNPASPILANLYYK